MKNKTKLFAIALLVSITSMLSAQNDYDFGTGKDSITCVENLAVYQHRYKNEEKTNVFTPETYKAWRTVMFSCPKASKNMYVPHGINLFTVLVRKEKDAVKKQKYIDTIMMIYDRRIEHFGEESRYIGLKGADLFLLNPDKNNEAFDLCKKSIDILGAKSDVKTMVIYMQTAVNKFNSTTLTKVEALQIYQQLAGYFDTNIQKGSVAHEKQKVKLDELFLELKPDCNDIVALFEPQYKQTPENVDLLKKIIQNLSASCKETDLYLNSVVSLDKLEPSAQSKRNIAEMYVSKKQNATALNFYKQAIDIETDNNIKAESYFRMAQIANGPSVSVGYAKSALSLNPNMGKAYLLIASEYAGSAKSCSDGAEFPEVAKWTVFWAAADMCNKAKSVDPSVTSQANSQYANYRAYFPDAEALFGYNISAGQSQSINCWFSATTTAKVK